MAFIFSDGFDHYGYAPATDIVKKWTSLFSTTITVHYNGGRRAGGALGLGADGGGTRTRVSKTYPNGNNPQTVTLGFAYKPVNAPIANAPFLYIMEGGAIQYQLVTNTSMRVLVQRGGTFNAAGAANGTLIGTSSGSLVQNGFQYIELKARIGPANSGTLELRINGSTNNGFPQITGVNTMATANSWSDSVILVGGVFGGLDSFFDDFYICDTSGSSFNDFLGDVEISPLYPSSNGGNFQQWSPTSGSNHFNLVSGTAGPQLTTTTSTINALGSAGTGNITVVNCLPTISSSFGVPSGSFFLVDNEVMAYAANSATQLYVHGRGQLGTTAATHANGSTLFYQSYVSSSVSGNMDLFGMTNLITGGAGTIYGAVVNLAAIKDDAGTRTISSVASASSVISTGSDHALGTSQLYYQSVYAVDPSTGAAWTVNGINGAEFGVKVTG